MIFFLHVPKTAGTTFYDIVKLNHGQFLKPKIEENPFLYLTNEIKNRLPGGYNTAPEILNIIKTLPNQYINNINFIGGHVGYGFHNQIVNNVVYMSFLRNPTERIISDYKEHCKKGRYFYYKLKNNNFSFNAYLQLILDAKLDNLLTRQMAGPFDFFLKDRDKINYKLLTIAQENTKNVTFFDLSKFDEALHYMKNTYNWMNCRYSIKNKSSNNKTTYAYDSELMEKVIYFDQQLYDRIAVANLNKFSLLQKGIFNFKNKFK